MIYADYNYYLDSFYGRDIDVDSYNRIASRASDYIDRITMNKAQTYTRDDAVKKACCAIAQIMCRADNLYAAIGDGEVASETVGSHSVSYRSRSDLVAAFDAEIKKAALDYLANTGLLYRGIPCIHHTPLRL